MPAWISNTLQNNPSSFFSLKACGVRFSWIELITPLYASNGVSKPSSLSYMFPLLAILRLCLLLILTLSTIPSLWFSFPSPTLPLYFFQILFVLFYHISPIPHMYLSHQSSPLKRFSNSPSPAISWCAAPFTSFPAQPLGLYWLLIACRHSCCIS